MLYVEELIGPDTVNTMPLETVARIPGSRRGRRRARSLQGIDEAKQLLADLAAAGVDYDDVVATLEAEGVQKFADSFAELLDGHPRQGGRAGGGVTSAAEPAARRVCSCGGGPSRARS